MNNRELTYYSLANRADLRHIEGLADNTPQETFIALGFEKKHFHHLWIGANNEAFISTVSFITDLKKLNTKLTTQLKRYNEKDNLNINSTKDWLKHTKFIFQDEYNKTQKEIFLEVVEWCKEQLIVDSNTTQNIKAKQQNEPDIIFNKSDPSSHLFYDFYKNIGWVDKIEKNTGLIINPTHSFELLKKKRLGLFEQEKESFIKERKVKGIDTSSKEMDTLYKVWLSSELKTMDDNFSTNEETISNQIEINKYRQFLKEEIQSVDINMDDLSKNYKCTSQVFISDISKLCDKCPLPSLINDGMKDQIIFQAQEQKEILTTEQFNNYLDEEIKSATKAMEAAFLKEGQEKENKNDKFRANRIQNYIWNKERIKALNKFKTTKNTVTKLPLKIIALKHVYEGIQITRQNGNSIAQTYGHKSGDKLFQEYTFYASSANRKGKPTPCTKVKLQNKINRLESVIELLPLDKQSRAKDEVAILRSHFDNEFG